MAREQPWYFLRCHLLETAVLDTRFHVLLLIAHFFRVALKFRYDQPGVNYTLLPRTLSALRRLPLAPETAAFQRQLPGTGLPLHVDPSNWVLGCHVGVVVPAPTGVMPVRPPGDAAGEGFREKGVIEGGHSSRSGTGFGRNGGGSRRDGGTKKIPSKANRRGGRDDGSGDRRTVTSTNYEVAEDGVGNAAPSRVSAKGSTATAATQEEEKVGHPPRAGVTVARQGGGGGDGGVGERAWMEVAGGKRNWEAGRAFVFDPSFLHRTHNPTSGERVILNVDIWHPELTEVERTAIRRVCELVEQWNARSGLFEG